MIGASVVMGVIGVRLTAVSPRLAGTGLTLPPALATALHLDEVGRTYRDSTTALLGAGSFFLPCGFTQAVQVLALSTGSPVRAGAIMAVFAVGTAPGLLGLGGLTAVVRGAAAPRFFRFAGVAVVAFALVNVSGALHILTPAIFLPPGGAATELSSNVTLDGDIQVLRTTQVADGYEPADAVVYAGREVRWELESEALTCASTIQSADIGIDVALTPGPNVVTFTPDEPGVLRYSCFMGMYTGTITVIEDPAGPRA
jgi:plastocyanin